MKLKICYGKQDTFTIESTHEIEIKKMNDLREQLTKGNICIFCKDNVEYTLFPAHIKYIEKEG